MPRPSASPLLPPSSPLGAAPRRAFQWDLARQLERLDWLLDWLPRYAEWGYQELYLHLESAVEYPSLPGVARRGALSRRELERLVRAAQRCGIGVVPIVNLLGHTQYLLDDPSLRDLNELRDAGGGPLARGQVCPLHPRMMEVAEKLLRDLAPLCTAGKVHAGLDESYHLGRHPLSRAEIARIGLAGHFAGYVRRLEGLAAALGLQLGLWADMLALLPAAIPLLPAGVVAYDWYYYPFRRRPRIELRNFAPVDLAPALRARGIEYWGCPMDGAFRHEPMPIFSERVANITSWWRRCRRTGAAGMLVTSWEPSRMAAESAVLVDAAAAGLWLDGEEDPSRLLAGGCRRLYGRRGAPIARALAMADRRPFSGYVRWRVDARWDGAVTDGPLAIWRAEARACRGLAARRGLPPAIGGSLRFRAYLAERDLFVRRGGAGVWGIRRAVGRGRRAEAGRLIARLETEAAAFGRQLAAGRSAAEEMWALSRPRSEIGPNHLTLDRDAARLEEWRAWLGASRTGGGAWRGGPMAGAWQLVFTVENFAPAAQKLVVQRERDGSWADVDGFFAIEFQGRAAHPRANIAHRVSVALSPGLLARPGRLSLRLVARGFGQLRIRRAILTNGVDRFALTPAAGLIGTRAPRSGFPDFDWAKNNGKALYLV